MVLQDKPISIYDVFRDPTLKKQRRKNPPRTPPRNNGGHWGRFFSVIIPISEISDSIAAEPLITLRQRKPLGQFLQCNHNHQ